MKYDEMLNKKIEENVDKNYQEFHSKIVPNTQIKGVRIPVLRKIAKEFSGYPDFLENLTLESYEAISVACYYIGNTTKDVQTLKTRLEFILPYINNWAICDTFVSSLKIFKTKNEETFPIVINYLNSKNNFSVRFSFVSLLNYFITENRIENLFEKIKNLQNRDYYLDMAIAWFVSVAFVKCKQQTLDLLKSKTLTPFVQNKSISKICDSFRVSAEDKIFVKKYRIK